MSITINRVYTKVGDKGETHLVGGRSVKKDDLRIEAYGTVDELNAWMGMVRMENAREPGPKDAVSRIDALIGRVQSELFNLGSILATLPEDVATGQPRILDKHVEALEKEIDELNESLPALRSFTLPGGGRVSASLHVARTVCRRAERRLVPLFRAQPDLDVSTRYLNRLSDWLYVLGRWNVRQRGETEPLWQPDKT